MQTLVSHWLSTLSGLSGRCCPEWPQVEFQVPSIYALCCVCHLQVPLLQRSERLPVMVIISIKYIELMDYLNLVKVNQVNPFSVSPTRTPSPSLLVQLRPARQTDIEETIKEFSAKLSLVPLPPPGRLHVVRKHFLPPSSHLSLSVSLCDQF